jgi:hypothetical protein
MFCVKILSEFIDYGRRFFMKNRKLSLVLIFALIISLLAATTPVFAKSFQGDGWNVTKISNPDRGEREVDGLVKGGDRENSYTWRLASRGDYVYIATTRNIASALVNMYGEMIEQAGGGVTLDSLWGVIDVVTNGDILRNPVSNGANIISYNRKTGEFKVIYTDDNRSYFRMAVTFGDDVYFGSYSAYPDVPQYILKLDKKGKFTKVFQTMGSVSLRANCVYDGHLFFAGADDREVVKDGDGTPTKMAVLRKSNEDDTKWERVADYEDFGEIPYDSIMSSWAGAPIWELTNHNGYIYATAPSTPGFVMFKGHPATAKEKTDGKANKYGWCWTEVAGLNNGVNNPGLSDKEGGEPGTMRSLIGSTFEFKGDLYAYNFDHAFGGEAKAFVGMMQQLAKKGVKASDYLSYMYDSLHNPQKLWKMDDKTGKFEECKGFTKLTEGTTNEYVWRAGEYDGQMYIATMDAKVFYGYLTQLTSTDFSELSVDQIMSRINYIKELINTIIKSKLADIVDISKLEKALELEQRMLEKLKSMTIDRDSVKAFVEEYSHIDEALENASAAIRSNLKGSSADQLVDSAVTNENLDNVGAGKITIQALLMRAGVSDAVSGGMSAKFNGKLRSVVVASLGKLKSVNELAKDKLQALREKARDIVKEYIDAFIKETVEKLKATFTKVDWEGFEMYKYISDMVKNDKGGFDLFRTKDAENFEVITRTGFDDKYNYGCSAFLATQEGLYIGTCNPFYGGQLYLLKTGIEKEYQGEPEKKTEPAEDTKNVSLKLKAGKTVDISKTVGAIKNWHSSKNKTATVKKGKITALKKGASTINVTFKSGAKYKYNVTVTTSPKLAKKSIKVKVGKKAKVKIIGKAPGVKNTYKNTKYAKITSKRTAKTLKVKGLKKGKTVLKVKVNGVNLKLKVTVK